MFMGRYNGVMEPHDIVGHRPGLGRLLDHKRATFVDTQSDAIAIFHVLELNGKAISDEDPYSFARYRAWNSERARTVSSLVR